MEWVITLGLGFAGRLGGDSWHVRRQWRGLVQTKEFGNVAWHGQNSSGLMAGLVQFYGGVVLTVTLGSGLLRVRGGAGWWALCGRRSGPDGRGGDGGRGLAVRCGVALIRRAVMGRVAPLVVCWRPMT